MRLPTSRRRYELIEGNSGTIDHSGQLSSAGVAAAEISDAANPRQFGRWGCWWKESARVDGARIQHEFAIAPPHVVDAVRKCLSESGGWLELLPVPKTPFEDGQQRHWRGA